MSRLHRWIMLCTLGLFFFMVIVDGSIVTIAVPAIASGLHVSSGQVNLIIIIYLIVISATLLTFGQLGDQVGRIRLFRLGTIVFLLGSIGAGLGPNLEFVLLGRLLQGIGAGMTMANSYAIVTDIFPKEMLGRALGIESIFISLGALAGPGLGGLLLGVTSWRAIFLVNVPVGVLCLVFEWWAFPKHPAWRRPHIDWLGSLLLGLAAISFYVSASELLRDPVSGLIFLTMFAGIAGLFYLAEHRVEHPLLDFGIFTNHLFSRSLLASMLSFVAAYFFTLLAPLYLQVVLHYSSQVTGLLLMVSPIVAIVANPLAGWLTDRLRAVRVMEWGMALLVVSELALVFSNAHLEPVVITVISGLLAIATAAFGTPSNTLIMSSTAPEQRGMAGAVNSLTREFGMVVGTTLASVVYYGKLSLDSGTTVISVAGQTPTLLLHAQSVAYMAATGLLMVGLWVIRPRKMRH